MQDDPRRDPGNHEDEVPDDGKPSKYAEKEIVNFLKLFPRGLFCIDILCSLFDL